MPSKSSRSSKSTYSTNTISSPSSNAVAASNTHIPQRRLASSSTQRNTACVARRRAAPAPSSPSSPSPSSAFTTTNNSAALVAPPRASNYGDVVESDAVHDDIRALGTEVKTVIAQRLPRNGTSAEQVVWGVRQFGPSKESRAVLNKENDAARLAWERGIYCVWRCTEPPKLRGAKNDFCCRLGYRHVCFCGHPMASHRTPPTASGASTWASSSSANDKSKHSGSSNAVSGSGGAAVSDRQLARWKAPCEEVGCGCTSFRYIPNTPLEIGEGWLTRRANFKASEWSAKCRCGHGHKAHDPSSYLCCRSCGGCSGFVSAFLCVVCDLPWEAHETVWESEGVRIKAGLPVQAAYAPLAEVDWDLREMVLTDASMGGRMEPSATYLALQARQGHATHSTRLSIEGPSFPSPAFPSPVVNEATHTPVRGVGGTSDSVVDVEYCPACATIYRSAASNFCAKCGQARPRRSSMLR